MSLSVTQLKSPNFHRVSADHYSNAYTSLLRMRDLGYRRIGCAMLAEIHERLGDRIGSAYDAMLRRFPDMEPIPFYMPEDYDRGFTGEKLRAWIRRHRVQALLTPHNDNLQQLQKTIGLKIPEEIGLLNLSCEHLDDEKTGVFENSEIIGQTMVNLVVAMLHRDEHGIPETHTRTLIEGAWVEGRTLRLLPVPGKKSSSSRK
ncbi:MAG: hypothetical protein WCH98_08145 [Verrucomicrobiota bacterium]